jgi:hypothetical protein
MLRFFTLNRRGRRTASRCWSTAFAWWIERREFMWIAWALRRGLLRWEKSRIAQAAAGSCSPADRGCENPRPACGNPYPGLMQPAPWGD